MMKKLTLFGSLALWLIFQTAPAYASINFIQAATSSDNVDLGTNKNGCNVTFPASTTVGNLIVISTANKIATTTLISVSDEASDTFIRANGTYSSTTGSLSSQNEGEIWYGLNILGGGRVMTLTFNNGNGNTGLNCVGAEFSGVNTFDVGNATGSTGNAHLMSSTSTTNFATELIVGGGGTPENNTAILPGSAYTKVSSSTGSRSILEYQIVTSTGAYSADATTASAHTEYMGMATFYQSAAPSALTIHMDWIRGFGW